MFKKRFVLAAAAALGVTQMASATPFIGVNFVGGSNGGAPTSMDPTDSAGVVPQTNYNNVTGNTGTNVALNDKTGAATAVTLTFSAAGTWGTGLGTADGNHKMLNGYVDGTDNGSNTFTFNNVPAGTYGLVIYSVPDSLDGRDESFVLNGDPTTKLFLSADAGAKFDTVGFLQATATVQDGAGATGNYIEYDNITLAAPGSISFTSTSQVFRNFENGIQLFSGTVPEPGTLAFLGLGGIGLLARRRRSR
jgi:hypothetical protein